MFKRSLVSVAVVLATLAAQPALAATQALNTLSGGGASFSDLTSTASFSAGVRSFSDTLSFTLDADVSSLSFTVSTIERLGNGNNWGNVNFNSLSISGLSVTSNGTGSGLTWTSTGPIAAGTYSLTFSGSGASPNGGNSWASSNSLRYDLAYTAVAVSPVPEPETYALMLAGLGLVAWVSRRRKTAGTAPALALPA